MTISFCVIICLRHLIVFLHRMFPTGIKDRIRTRTMTFLDETDDTVSDLFWCLSPALNIPPVPHAW